MVLYGTQSATYLKQRSEEYRLLDPRRAYSSCHPSPCFHLQQEVRSISGITASGADRVLGIAGDTGRDIQHYFSPSQNRPVGIPILVAGHIDSRLARCRGIRAQVSQGRLAAQGRRLDLN